MDRSWWWRTGLIAAIALGAIWFLVPSYYSFVVLPKDKRNDLKALLEQLGGKVTSSVSKTTDYVVAGADAGTKADKAAELNVPIIDQAALLQLIEKS